MCQLSVIQSRNPKNPNPRRRTNVDENALDLLLRQEQLERLLDRLGRSPTSDVQKVGRVPSVQLEHVHRGHGKTGSVDETSDVAVQLDKVQPVLGRFDLLRVFLGRIPEREDVFLTEVGVVVETELGVHAERVFGRDEGSENITWKSELESKERYCGQLSEQKECIPIRTRDPPENLAIRHLAQRVDLDLRSILVLEDAIKLAKHIGRVLPSLFLEPELLGQGDPVGLADPVVEVQFGGDDRLGGIVCDLFDVHTSLVGSHQDRAAPGSVEEDGRVIFLLRGQPLGQHDGVTQPPRLPSLLGNQLFAQHLPGDFLGLGGGIDHLNTSLVARGEVALSSTSCEDLGFEDERVGVREGLGYGFGFRGGKGGFGDGGGDVILPRPNTME